MLRVKALPHNKLYHQEATMLKVNWDEAKCIHSGNCVKGFPQVFKIENEQFVINESGGTEDDLRAAVAACPSGALTLEEV